MQAKLGYHVASAEQPRIACAPCTMPPPPLLPPPPSPAPLVKMAQDDRPTVFWAMLDQV